MTWSKTERDKERRLRRLLLLFCLALVVPTVILLFFAYGQLKWEIYHQFRGQAEALANQIEHAVQALVTREEARTFSDYQFLVVAGNPGSNILKRSPLSLMPDDNLIPGLVGYFQIDPDGQLSSPLVPSVGISASDYGVTAQELEQRTALVERMRNILNRPAEALADSTADGPLLVAKDDLDTANEPKSIAKNAAESDGSKSPMAKRARAPASSISKQKVFERFDQDKESAYVQNRQRLGSVSELQLDESLEKKASARALKEKLKSEAEDRQQEKRISRKEQIAVYELDAPAAMAFDMAPNADRAPEGSAKVSGMRSESPAIFSQQADKLAEHSAAPAEATRDDAVSSLPAGSIAASEPMIAPKPQQASQTVPRINTFESEIGPLSLETFDEHHFVLFRNVWRAGARYIQGAIVDRDAFTRAEIGSVFEVSALASMSQLLVAFNDDVLNIFGVAGTANYITRSKALTGDVLLRTRLANPFDDLSLLFNITKLPVGPSVRFLTWVSLVLFSVLIGGCYVIYRYGHGQIRLLRQQQDFVSAVSHELKTPLTSIRMYSEMLKNDWATEEKRAGYYQYIHEESERLSRLINNILQLARMNRNQTDIELKDIKMGEIVNNALSKISSQIDAAGFELETKFSEPAMATVVQASADAAIQIVINLIDNAIKFSRDSEIKKIDFRCEKLSDGRTELGIRDYGPGIDPSQMKKIFDLFYRSENELTRETVGTGIGLALVHQLASAMSAKIDVHNHSPGVEFTVTFPSPRGDTR